MRELVYLSDRKLEQFLPALRSLWPRPKISFRSQLVEFDVAPTQDGQRDRLRHLARVIAHIEKSARWFLDPDVSAGHWVHFEAPLNYLVLNSELVFFVDRPTATPDYPAGGAGRLVLHCSSAHLRMETPPTRMSAPQGDPVPVPASGSGPGILSVDNIQLLLKSLHARNQPADEPRPLPEEHTWYLPAATSRLLRAIDARVHPETAAWMAGYARVTASFDLPAAAPVRHVIASPLYIEYATPPSTT